MNDKPKIRMGIVGKYEQTVFEYLVFLETKGFLLGEDAKGFIAFGQGYTGCSDRIVNCAIEITLKVQCSFDGSFFISLLEEFSQHDVNTRSDARLLAEKMGVYKQAIKG